MNLKEEYYIRVLEALIQHKGNYVGVEARALEVTNKALDTLAEDQE